MCLAKKLVSLLPCFALAAAAVLFLSAPAHYAETIRKGISLWAVNVLPVLFPFLVFSPLFADATRRLPRRLFFPAQKIFRLSPRAAAVLPVSALSGYPVGARLTAELAPSLSAGERLRLACLSSTAGPVFLVGTVGGVLFKSTAAGVVLLFSHFAAVRLSGILLALRAPAPICPPLQTSEPTPFSRSSDGMAQAILSVLCIGGTIALFYCLGEMLSDLGLFSLPVFRLCPYAEGIVRGAIEMTTGCAVLAAHPSPISLALCCALVTAGGGCVLLQQTAYLKGILPLKRFFAVKLLQAAAAFFLCLLLANLFLFQ